MTNPRHEASPLRRMRRSIVVFGVFAVAVVALSGGSPRAVAAAGAGAALALAEFEGVSWSVTHMFRALSSVSWAAWFLQLTRLGAFGAVLYFLVVRHHWPVGPMLLGFGALPLGVVAAALWAVTTSSTVAPPSVEG